jgi:hypothetical protein
VRVPPFLLALAALEPISRILRHLPAVICGASVTLAFFTAASSLIWSIARWFKDLLAIGTALSRHHASHLNAIAPRQRALSAGLYSRIEAREWEVIETRYESQIIRLRTDSDYRKRLPVGVCGDLLRLLKPLMTYSVRMAVEGSSIAVGRMPGWLTCASDIRLADYARDRDDTLIKLDVPSLGNAAPELYDQGELWPTKPDARYTAVDVFCDVIGEVAAGNLESDRYDRPLLLRLGGMQRVFSDHLSAIVLPRESRTLTQDVAQGAERIADSTPPPQEIRVVGQLDMIRKSTRSFGLQLDDGSELHGVMESSDDVERLKELFGRRVLVLGKAVYRPSGSLLRIDAHCVEVGEGQPAIFSKTPPARRRRIQQPARKLSSEGWRSFAQYFGSWPGDETNEQWEEMLLELKK